MDGLQIALAVLTIVAFVGLGWCLRGVQKDVERHDKEIADLQEKLKKPSSLPYQTREEIENAVAALIVLNSELDFKKSLVENAMEHMRKARNPKVK